MESSRYFIRLGIVQGDELKEFLKHDIRLNLLEKMLLCGNAYAQVGGSNVRVGNGKLAGTIKGGKGRERERNERVVGCLITLEGREEE